MKMQQPKKRRVVLVTFSIRNQRFGSPYERNQFYRGLYGWRQVIVRERRSGKSARKIRYEYQKPGLLDDIPHLKVDQSLFMIAKKHLDEIEQFFNSWGNKVFFNTFDVIINKEMAKKLKQAFEE